MRTNICRTSICRLILSAWDRELLIITLRFTNFQRFPSVPDDNIVTGGAIHVLRRFTSNWCGKWCRVTGWSTPSSSIHDHLNQNLSSRERGRKREKILAVETSLMKEVCFRSHRVKFNRFVGGSRCWQPRVGRKGLLSPLSCLSLCCDRVSWPWIIVTNDDARSAQSVRSPKVYSDRSFETLEGGMKFWSRNKACQISAYQEFTFNYVLFVSL